MTPAAAMAAMSTTYTHRRPKRRSAASRNWRPASRALMPTTAAPALNATAAYPSAAFMRPPSRARSAVGVHLRRRVVGAVPDEDAIGQERRIGRLRRPVTFD